jgi:hypothetical protein
LDGIIAQLEHQRAAIERALAALCEAGEIEDPTPSPSPSGGAGTRKFGMTPEGRKRLSAALIKRRWAAKRAAAEGAKSPVPQEAAPRKGGMTEDGRIHLNVKSARCRSEEQRTRVWFRHLWCRLGLAEMPSVEGVRRGPGPAPVAINVPRALCPIPRAWD